jgi:hypothetical protein
MINRKQRSGSRKTHCFSRALRHELLESRSLMAGDILDTPTDPNVDISSGYAEVRAALDFEGDVDALRLIVSNHDSFSAGAWKANGEPLRFRVLDAAGQDVSDTLVDSSGVISLVGSAKGQYSLQISSETDEVADYMVRVKAWTEGFPPDSSEPDGDPVSGDDPVSGYPDGRDPSKEDPEVGIPDGKGPDGTDQDGGRPDDEIDIRIILRDGVYFYGDDLRWSSGDMPSGWDPDAVMLEGSVPDGKGSDGSLDVTDADGGRPGDDFDIRIVLRDGVYDYEGGSERTKEDVPSNDGPDDRELVFQPVQGNMRLAMYNAESPADVDGDESLSPLDALALINLLNTQGGGDIRSFARSAGAQGESSQSASYYDTNNDGYISPLDVLFVINQLNLQSSANSAMPFVGERETDSTDSAFAAAVDWAFASGEDDEDETGLLCVLPMPDLI